MDEGYIKFNCSWESSEPPAPSLVDDINSWRNKLYALGLIGMYPDGIGFGNISKRTTNGFVISGTSTGKVEQTDNSHYAIVTGYDIANNTLNCRGPVMASSESLTHAALYEKDHETNVVIHIHNLELWEKHLNQFPTTAASIPYGTPEMANEIARLFKETNVAARKVIIMAGHQEGIIVWGKDADEAGRNVMEMM
jgi:ribulose-5-phosphate 4-epimerase/fuculose-1-phosphate aldolase